MTGTMKSNILKVVIFLIAILNINTDKVFSQTNLKFKNITIEQGLSQGTVETIYQDSEGYIWIGTQDGLNRYNGYEVKQYRYNEKSKNSIINNNIMKINEDKDNNIWVGTIGGISKISKDGKITNYTTSEKNGNLSNDNICDILITSKEEVLVATIDGINRYDEKTDSFKRILSNKDDLTSQFVYSLGEDKNNNIWIGTDDGLNKYNTKTGKIEKNYLTKTNEKDKDRKKVVVYTCFIDNENYIWAGTIENGFYKINTENNKIVLHKKSPSNKELNFVKDIMEDSENKMWICTDDGLIEFDEEKDKTKIYLNKPYDAHSLNHNSTRSIMQDKNGLIWIGTYTGISVFDPKNRITHYESDPYDKNSLSSSVIHGIYQDKDGLIWAGTRSDGVNIINRKKDDIRTIKSDRITDDRIRCITGIDDEIWIGTNDGLNKINKKEKTITRYKVADGLLDNYITYIYIHKNDIFVCTGKGINVIDRNTGEIRDINSLLDKYNVPKKYIPCIYIDKENLMWIGSSTYGGLTSINIKDEKSKTYKKENGLSTNEIRNVIEDSKGNLWIATNYGLNKLNKNTGKIVHFTEQEGLPNNTVYSIVLDSDENPWMSTNNGISKFDVSKNKFINLNVTDGLQGNEFNGNACFKNDKGEILFGGINGLNILNPKNLITSKDISEVMIDDILINGASVENRKNLEFESDENTIEIKYFLPDYKNTQKVQYIYKLEGGKDNWHTVKDNKATYTNLSPGKYRFIVKAINNSGVMSDDTVINFKVKPPWWRSKKAMFLYSIMVVAAIANNQRKIRRLDELVSEKTHDLEEKMEENKILYNKVIELERRKNNYFINLSHELRTPLNLIYGVQQLITSLNTSGVTITHEKMEYFMNLLKTNSDRLLNLINNIIDTSKIENGNYTLNTGEHDIVYIVEKSALSFSNLAREKGIELIVDPLMEEKIIICDKEDIDRCIVNLVNNAIKFTEEGGKIEVLISEVEDNVRIVISDTGVGIDEKYHKSIFNRFNQIIDEHSESKQGSGLGLTITQNIIKMHKGKIHIESELGKGTKFVITLPVDMNKITS